MRSRHRTCLRSWCEVAPSRIPCPRSWCEVAPSRIPPVSHRMKVSLWIDWLNTVLCHTRKYFIHMKMIGCLQCPWPLSSREGSLSCHTVRGVSFCCFIRQFAKLSIKSFTISDGYWRRILIRNPTQIISWMNWSKATHIVGKTEEWQHCPFNSLKEFSLNSIFILFYFQFISRKKKKKEKKPFTCEDRWVIWLQALFDYKLMFHVHDISCNQRLKTYYIHVGMPSIMKKKTQIQMDFYVN